MTFEEGFLTLLMDPDRLRSLRTLTQAQVDSLVAAQDATEGPYVPHHHHVEYGEAAH